MFEELKKAKTLREIYTIMGVAPFEKVALVLLCAWCLLPIYASIDQIHYGLSNLSKLGKLYATMAGYKLGFQFIGSLSLVFVVFYLLGRIVMNRGQILHKIKSSPWHFLLLAMLLWSCISTLLSEDILTSFQGTDYRFDGLKSYFFYAAMYVCAFIVANSKYRKIVFNIFIMVSNFVGLIVIMQDFGVPLINQCFFQDVRSAMFYQYNHTAYFMNMAIVCLMGLYIYEQKRWLRIVYALSLGFQIYAILVNSTFACYLASCCAMIMVIAFYVRKYKRFSWKLLTPVILVFVISFASYMGWVPTSSGQDMKVNLAELKEDTSAIIENPLDAKDAGHGRMNLWLTGLKMVPEKPIFGHGPEQLNEKYKSQMLNELGNYIDRPDNEFIQHAIFLGIPGLLFYLAALISLFIRQWIHMRKLDDTTLIAAGCVIAYLVSSMFGNTMFYTVPYFYMFLAFASGRNVVESEK